MNTKQAPPKATRVLSYNELVPQHGRRNFNRLKRPLLLGMAVVLGYTVSQVSERISHSSDTPWILSDNIRNLSNNRSIASASVDNPVAERKLASYVVNNLKLNAPLSGEVRTPANFGRSPNPLDQIRFGLLAGKYRISQTENNRLIAAEFIGNTQDSDHPELPEFIDREGFLAKYRDSLAADYSRYEFVSINGMTHSYRLKGQQNNIVGNVDFTLDKVGRLLKIRVGSAKN